MTSRPTRLCLPFLIGKVCQPHELCAVRTDEVSLGLLQDAHLERAGLPVYVEDIIVRDIQLLALPEQSPTFFSYELRRGQQGNRAPSRGLVLSPQAVVDMGC
jgi:hypothetical protein